MIEKVALGEELVITAKNEVGLLADISIMLANLGVNIEAALGYREGKLAKLMLVTDANLAIAGELDRKKYKSVEETEVIIVDILNRPGALKVVTTELKLAGIDIWYLYVTPPADPKGGSRMVLKTSDNEKAMAVLAKYIESEE
jgi:hypothetical protein